MDYIPLLHSALAESDDLRRPQYRGDVNPLVGHCYVAAEALWHLIGGRRSGYVPHVARCDDGITHWWLEAPNGARLDPTAGQFDDHNELAHCYRTGRPCGFLTVKPSRRARTLISRLRRAQWITTDSGKR